MAGNEGTSQTELFTGWSSVVHQPCEEPEESELPSTVDMAAFSTGLSVEPANAAPNNDNTDSDSDSDVDSSNSGSEASLSCTQSDSSDSDSSTSSQESSSRSPSPEFSVTSSQTNGLRLTIATVKKSLSPTADKPAKIGDCSSSSDSLCSTDSGSESEASSTGKVSKVSAKTSVKDNRKVMSRLRTRLQDKKDDKKGVKKEPTSSNKVANSRPKLRQKKAKKVRFSR